MSWGAMAGQAASTAADMWEAHGQGASKAASSKFSALQDELNAQRTAQELSATQQTLRRKNRAELSSLAAAQAQNGLSGGVFDRIYVNSARNLEQDAANSMYQGLSQWAQYKNSAAMNRLNAQTAKSNARLNMWSSAISGASSLLGMGADYSASRAPKANLNGTASLDTPLSKNILNYQKSNMPWTM